MSVTIKDVEHIANLARLEFSEEEKEKFTHQLNDILKYVEKLNELDTSQVEPLLHVIESSQGDVPQNVFREDNVMPSISREEALKNAPAKTEEYFKVPKVIG